MGTTEITRAAAYIRCSTDRQDQSLGDQRAAILAYAKEREIQVVKWFEDEGKSGTAEKNRPGFQDMIRTVENGQKEFCLLLVYDISRWGRWGDPDAPAYWEYHCKLHKVGVRYTNEVFENDNSMSSNLVKSVRRSSAGQYSIDLAKLTVRGNKSNAAKGFFNGGQPPYAYRRMLCETDGTPIQEMGTGERKAEKSQKIKLILGPHEEVELVRRVYQLCIDDGHSAKVIARILEAERRQGGIPSPRGGAWSQSTIHGMLRNPTYCGRIVWGRRCYHHLIYPIELGKHHDPDDWVVCKDAHPAIVPVETWEEAQKDARHYANFRRPKSTSPYLLVGLIRCMKCGHNYQGQYKSGSKKKPNEYRYYVCRSYQRYGRDGCVSYSIPKEEIEQQIIDQIFKHLKRSGALNRIAKQLEEQISQETTPPTEQIDELITELQEVEIKEQRLLTYVEEGTLPHKTVSERFKLLEAEKDRLQDEIAALEGSEAIETDPETALEQMMGFLGNFRAILKEGTLDEQRTLIQCFVDRIEVDPEGPSIEVFMYKVPEVDLENLQELETTNP